MPACSCGWTACHRTLGVVLECISQFVVFSEKNSVHEALQLLGDPRQSTSNGMVGTFAS